MKEFISPDTPVFVVCDRNVRDYAAALRPSDPVFEIDASEENKTLETVTAICRWLLEQGADRNALVLSVGGGVTSDAAGFAASIYKRGIRYANAPTTLLAQVDAAIGGKTGVNLDSYKNILGIIRQPEFTHIDPSVLRTLPRAEFISGEAELLKTFIIGDEKLYSRAVTLLRDINASPSDLNPGQEKELGFLIEAAGAIKRRIVKADPFERGLRRILNLGHTYAHAIEWYQHSSKSNPPLTHGEAVAVGIIKAAQISEAEGVCGHSLPARLEKDFAACGLPVKLPCRTGDLTKALARDKKAENGRIHFVLIKDIGKVIVRTLSPDSL